MLEIVPALCVACYSIANVSTPKCLSQTPINLWPCDAIKLFLRQTGNYNLFGSISFCGKNLNPVFCINKVVSDRLEIIYLHLPVWYIFP